MEDKYQGFFGDMKSFLLRLLLGFVSFVVIINLFLNHLREIFHLEAKTAFLYFSFIYFILPILIVVIYVLANRSFFFNYVLEKWSAWCFLFVVILIIAFSTTLLFFDTWYVSWLYWVYIALTLIALVCILLGKEKSEDGHEPIDLGTVWFEIGALFIVSLLVMIFYFVPNLQEFNEKIGKRASPDWQSKKPIISKLGGTQYAQILDFTLVLNMGSLHMKQN